MTTTTKTCVRCGEDQPLDQYHLHSSSRNGICYPRRYCITCENAKKRASYVRRTQTVDRALSDEITALIKATTVRCGAPKPELPTADELAAWFRAGCPIRTNVREGCRI